jgi:hypothetical protein
MDSFVSGISAQALAFKLFYMATYQEGIPYFCWSNYHQVKSSAPHPSLFDSGSNSTTHFLMSNEKVCFASFYLYQA